MASSADALIGSLLAGTGFGRTSGDIAQQNQQIQGGAQALQLGALQLAGLKQQQAKAQQDQVDYTNWQADFSKDPTPDKLLTGITRFPQQYQALKSAWDLKDGAAKSSDLSFFTQVHAALDNGKPEFAQNLLQQRIEAEKRAGKDASVDESYLEALKSGDPAAQKALKAIALGGIGVATGPDKFASTFKAVAGDPDANHYGQFGSGGIFDQRTGQVVRNPSEKPDYKIVKNADGTESVIQVGGGDPASSGTAAGGGDTSRLINSDAGGGYVPDSVKTLGQFVTYGKAMNARGAKSSSAGTYQINGTTMAEFAPQVLGADWKSQPFNADSQEKVGEAIFNWAKQQPDPAKALRGRWVSLSPQQASQLVQGDWSQARSAIAQGETGGAPGASASRAAGIPAPDANGVTDYSKISPGAAAKVVYTSKAADAGDTGGLTPDALDFAANWAIAHGGKAPPGFSRNKPAQVALQNAIADKAKSAGLTAEQVVQRGQDFVTEQQTLNAFAKGKQGDAVRSGSVALDHLAVLHDAVLALKNGNIPVFNQFSQNWQRITGNPLPTNATAIKGIVADEVNKAVLAGSGALADRKDVKDTLDLSGSPEQILGAVRGYTNLLGGQLAGLERQYSTNAHRNDFNKFLSPTAQRLLAQAKQTENGGSSRPVAVRSPAEAMKLPSGTLFTTPDGRTLRKR